MKTSDWTADEPEIASDAERAVSNAHSLSGRRNGDAAVVRSVIAFINANLGASLAIPLLASHVHLSAWYFARLFKRATGLAPHQFIIHRRLLEAAHLMTRTSLTLADIAYDTGFASQSQLAKMFRRWAGVTPVEFRRTNGGKALLALSSPVQANLAGGL